MTIFLVFFLLLGLLVRDSGRVEALAPPHPDFVDGAGRKYENVHQYRRRLNVTYSYRPKFISAEQCRYWSESKCEEVDSRRGKALEDHRRKLEERRRLNPSMGQNFRGLVLLIMFPEDAEKVLAPKEHFEMGTRIWLLAG